jgi:hypothetical protein
VSTCRGVRVWAAFVCACVATLAHADIDVGSGASLSFGDGALDVGCSNMVIAGWLTGGNGTVHGMADLTIAAGGSLAPGAGQIVIGGDFADAGIFTSGSSSFSIVDACGDGTTTFSGATQFYDLAVTTATGKQLVLPAAQTQHIAHALTLRGSAGNLLQVLSSSAGQQALLDVSTSAAQSIAYVNARDDKANGATIAPGTAASHQSVDSGKLINWFTDQVVGPGRGAAPIPAPMLGLLARLALLTGMLLLAWHRRRGLVHRDERRK